MPLTYDEAAKAIHALRTIASAIAGNEDSEHPSVKSDTHDAIREMCIKYCDAHRCDTCKVGRMIRCDEDWCVVRLIATSSQPTEAMLTEVMRFDKEGDPKPRSYAEDYFDLHPEAIPLAIEKNGVRMPHVCRVSQYEHTDACPGGMTCWECWQKPMKG